MEDTYKRSIKSDCKTSIWHERKNLVSTKDVKYQEVFSYFINGNFKLYLQPKVNSKSLFVIGFEGLVRICKGNEVVMSPQQIFSVIHGTILNACVGFWVVKTAFDLLEKTSDFNCGLSVNIEGGILSDDVFHVYIKELIKLHPYVSVKRLEFEIVETHEIFNIEKEKIKIKRISDMGFRIALDDFGMGYSSLFYLKELPINTLKIDREFVKDIVSNTRSKKIANTIINLAETMAIDCIAEGVETQAQLNVLNQLGCNVFQGFLISEPFPVENLANWYRQWNHSLRKAIV